MRPLLALLFLALLAGGCSAPPPAVDVLRIEPGGYEVAFDAALEAARSSGLPAAVRDRRSGVIETEPGFAPSYLEPWARGHDSPGRRLEQTISFERLRARFEFTPAAFDVRAAAGEGVPREPDILALEEPIIDRSRYDGELELRVWVYVEQSHHPGVRRGTWTRRNLTRSVVVPPDAEDGRPLPTVFWTPVSRDREFEQALLAKVQEEMGGVVAP